jgi:hypothetical protein
MFGVEKLEQQINNGYQGWTLKVVTVTEDEEPGEVEVVPTVEVSAGLDSFSRTVKVTLNVEDPENYKVTYTDGTELKYYAANKCFKAVIYSTDEAALGNVENFNVFAQMLKHQKQL